MLRSNNNFSDRIVHTQGETVISPLMNYGIFKKDIELSTLMYRAEMSQKDAKIGSLFLRMNT